MYYLNVVTLMCFVGWARPTMDSDPQKIVDFRLGMSRAVRDVRETKGWTQKELAKAIRSSQPRVAKIEAGSPDVSLDLMMRGFFAVGGQLPEGLPVAQVTGKTEAPARRKVKAE